MNARSEIPAAVTARQIAASDPAISAWVSANAGSGKTHVLAQRVIRLLLAGVDPAKILCLTFTKAAAANMANRVFGTLASWTALDDDALDRALFGIEGRAPSAERRTHARRLFAEALETPGGLKVQTIHAFCTALLHQFPFEAGVPARFEVMEEAAEAELIDRLRLEVLLEASAKPDSALGRALATAIVSAADITFADVIRDAVGKRAALAGWIGGAGGLDAALAQLSAALGVAPGETLDAVHAEFFASPHLPRSEWMELKRILASGLKSDIEHIERLERAAAGLTWNNAEAYVQVFCRKDFERRRDILTKGLRTKHPALVDRLMQEQERVCALLDRRRAVIMRDRSTALVTVAHTMLTRYAAEKAQRALLDYDDLIEKTLALFDNAAAAWVHYKLDLGIDHVLVDEAQDTSPQQWEIIRKLTAEFTAGAGARGNTRRSIFAVGDEKQSIYSFQGAAPHRFDEMRRHFEREHRAAERGFEPVPLTTSFRSSPDILGAVDAVFAREAAYQGLSSHAEKTVHEAVRRNAPGYVELWAIEEPDPKAQMEAWDAPFDAVSEESPRTRLARRIARDIRAAIVRGDRVGDGEARRPVRPGDFLVLVRQRGPLFEAIIRALKEEQVEVAGADRLILTEHIAVMDLIALADALLLPEDDLALACALKSPLFGFDDAQLFEVAHGRRSSLRRAMRDKVAEQPLFAQAHDRLDRLARLSRELTPFDFFSRLLGPERGRARMLARLGLEAADALDEFLSLALEYERRHAPSLQGFLAWLRAAQVEVKRDMDIVRDEVRVMTIHGAKGLEAPVVYLADTTTKPEGPRDPPVLQLGADAPMVWASARANDVGPVADARTAALRAARDEHSRLLYVAMTRAADRLIVCGARGQHRIPPGCWYELVRDALKPDALPLPPEDGGEVRAWRWRKLPPPSDDAPRATETAADTHAPLPDWLTQPAPTPRAAPATLSPSLTPQPRWRAPANAEAVASARDARRRGIVVHRLLASLPDVAPERRLETARRFLARPDAGFEAAEVEAMLGRIAALLAHPAFAALCGTGSQAEVPIVGRLKRPGREPVTINGRIDRLAVTPDAVTICDFKTDQKPPARAADVSPTYRSQMALYRTVVQRLFPGRPVKAVLVFTESAQIIELADADLDMALASLAAALP